MRRILAVLFVLLILPLSASAWMSPLVCSGGGQSAAPATFCATAGIFCMDAESGGQVTMQAGASDCDGYDANGDYCLQDGTTYKNGSYALGIMGSGFDYYSRDALDSSVSEFYVEFWYRTNAGPTLDRHVMVLEDASNNEVVSVRKDPNYGLNAACNGTTWDAGNDHIPNNTWVHIGLYYKEETGDGNNDGIVRVWLNTDGSEFDAGDLLINQTSVDTVSNDAAKIRMSGPYINKVCHRDDVRVTSGAPSWPTS